MLLGQQQNSTAHSNNNCHRSILAVATGDSIKPGTRAAARCEMNSHTDTCVAGPNVWIGEYTGKYCDVTPYFAEYQPMTNVRFVNASTAFTNNTTGETTILQFNQVLWYSKKLEMRLINPNQLGCNGLSFR